MAKTLGRTLGVDCMFGAEDDVDTSFLHAAVLPPPTSMSAMAASVSRSGTASFESPSCARDFSLSTTESTLLLLLEAERFPLDPFALDLVAGALLSGSSSPSLAPAL